MNQNDPVYDTGIHFRGCRLLLKMPNPGGDPTYVTAALVGLLARHIPGVEVTLSDFKRPETGPARVAVDAASPREEGRTTEVMTEVMTEVGLLCRRCGRPAHLGECERRSLA